MYGRRNPMPMETRRESTDYIWDLNRFLGKGAHGNVYRGSKKSTGEAVAVKVVKNLSDRERDVLMNAQHENIVKLIAIECEKSAGRKDVIVMELCRGGSLSSIMGDPENSYGLPEDEFLTFLDSLYKVTKYLREIGIAHRDWKPANWVKWLGDDGESIYKLTDFGAAKELKEGEPFDSIVGTPDYLDPAVYNQAFLKTSDQPNMQFTSAIDLWSIGTTIYEVATGKLPFRPYKGSYDKQTMGEMRSKKRSGIISCYQVENGGPIFEERTLPDDCLLSLALKDLVSPILASLMEVDAQQRITYDDFFSQMEGILTKKRVYVFFLNRLEKIRLYLTHTTEHNIRQELYRRTEVDPKNQLLCFKESSLDEFTSSNGSDTCLLRATSEDNPIIFCNRGDNSITVDNLEIVYRKSVFSNRIDEIKDSEVARKNCCLAYFRKRRLSDMISRVQLLHLAVDTISKVVIIQLAAASKDNIQIHCTLNSLTRQFDMMKHFHASSQSFLDFVPDELMECKTKIVKNMEISFTAELNQYKTLLNESKLLSPSIESLLKQRVGSRHLLNDWEVKYQKIPKINEFGKVDKASSTVLDRIKASFISLSRERSLPTDQDVEIYLMERIKLMRQVDSLERILNNSISTFEAIVSVFSDWYETAQTAFIQPEILNKEIASLRERLHNCEENLGKSFLLYKAELEKFPDGIVAAKRTRKTSKEKKQESLRYLNDKLSKLKCIHHEIYTCFEANKQLCDQLQNITAVSSREN